MKLALNLEFYEMTDDPRTVSKALGTARKVANVFLKDEQNVVNPTFVVAGAPAVERYVYCPELKRYYFIDGVTIEIGNKVSYACSIDVLMTYKDQIMNTDVIVYNQGETGLANRLIADGRIPLQVNTESRTFNFKNGELGTTINDYNFVLNCFGGRKGTTA